MSLENLVAWAKIQGFDPDYDYTGSIEMPPPGSEPEQAEPNEPEFPPGQLSANFNEREFRCRGTGTLPPNGMCPKLIAALQRIRDHYGRPVTINSGFRSVSHNRSVGGAANSQHIHGTAADFGVQGVPPSEVFAWLNSTHPGGLGRYNTFTHIDTRPARVRW
jgi:hypothetical protein